jgi:hypothetical protein
MIRALIRWLSDGAHKASAKGRYRDEPSPRSQAYAELRSAESRGDTRSIGTARMKLAQATHDQLSAEVWG